MFDKYHPHGEWWKWAVNCGRSQNGGVARRACSSNYNWQGPAKGPFLAKMCKIALFKQISMSAPLLKHFRSQCLLFHMDALLSLHFPLILILSLSSLSSLLSSSSPYHLSKRTPGRLKTCNFCIWSLGICIAARANISSLNAEVKKAFFYVLGEFIFFPDWLSE